MTLMPLDTPPPDRQLDLKVQEIDGYKEVRVFVIFHHNKFLLILILGLLAALEDRSEENCRVGHYAFGTHDN